MDIRSQVSMVFHLDKCIGCHTCSVICKNIWTPREGAEYMWWNNVETKPGTGYPAPGGDDQPGARPVSRIDGRFMEIEAGPNWDDDLSGSPIYAANDPGLGDL